VLFALPNEAERRNDLEIAIPKLASLYLVHDADGEVRGLNDFMGRHPPVAPVFWSFRIMVGTGLLMLAVSWLGLWHWRRRQALPAWLARALVAMTFAGWVAVLAGWYTTEIGRQPDLVYGVLTTAQAASKVGVAMVGTTLALYLTLYAALLAAYISVVFHLARKAAGLPAAADPPPVAWPAVTAEAGHG
jgi:cytochrome d ubiquinol oxidase subunit I